MKRLVFYGVAEADIAAAEDWYDGQQPGLSEQFRVQLEFILQSLNRHPEMYQRVCNDACRAVLHVFPYQVVYRVMPEHIEVIGVLHCHADPAALLARAASARPPH